VSQISGFDALPRFSLAPLRARDIKRRIKRESAGRERTGLRAPLFPASPSPSLNLLSSLGFIRRMSRCCALMLRIHLVPTFFRQADMLSRVCACTRASVCVCSNVWVCRRVLWWHACVTHARIRTKTQLASGHPHVTLDVTMGDQIPSDAVCM
jgi:hypothetical protein